MSQKGSLTRNIFDQKFFHPLVVVARELGAARPGPAEHRGTVGIRPNHLLAATATLALFKPGADYDQHMGMSPPNFKPFRWACRSDNDMSIWSSGGKKQLYPTQDRGTI